MFKGELFRVMKRGRYYAEPRNNFPVILAGSDGSVCYWLNGEFLKELKRDQSMAPVDQKLPAFISYKVDGDAAPLPNGGGPSWMEEAGDAFFRDHGELHWMQECVRQERKKGYPYGTVKRCIKARVEQGRGQE